MWSQLQQPSQPFSQPEVEPVPSEGDTSYERMGMQLRDNQDTACNVHAQEVPLLQPHVSELLSFMSSLDQLDMSMRDALYSGELLSDRLDKIAAREPATYPVDAVEMDAPTSEICSSTSR